MEQQVRFARSSDGVRIAYSTTGAGPPIVRVANWLTHLTLDTKSPIWAHWFRELSRGQTLVRYDPRGTGLSDRFVDTFNLDAWVGDLEAVVDDLGLDHFPLLGFCQGGPVAIAYAVRHPERVSHLILYDAFAQGALVAGAPPRLAREAEALAEMIAVGWGRQAVAFREVFANLIIPGASKEQQRWLAELEQRTVSPETAVRLWRAFHHLDVRALLPAIEVPTLIFHIRKGCMVPFEAGRQLAATIPNARFVPLEGQNHILLADEPSWPVFLDEVRAFLGTSLSPALSDRIRARFAELTEREREVLELMARGLTNDQIAARLVIAPKTARNHVAHIYDKLEVRHRARVVVLARQAGFGRGDAAQA